MHTFLRTPPTAGEMSSVKDIVFAVVFGVFGVSLNDSVLLYCVVRSSHMMVYTNTQPQGHITTPQLDLILC